MMIDDLHTRERALDPTHSFIVQAPAGSGKTELLTQRYLILLSRANKAPEEIVAITFTRKAVAEMRARILNALQFAQQVAPDKNDYRYKTWYLASRVLEKDKQLNWQLIKNPNRLRILTIDALATFLCRQTPVLTQFGIQPPICEDATAHYLEASRQFILYLTQTKTLQPYLSHLLLHLDNQATKLENLFAHLLSQREQWLSHILQTYSVDTNSLKKALENSLKHVVLEKLLQASDALPQHITQTLLLLMRHVGDYFQSSDHILSHAIHWHPKQHALKDFNAWLALANLLLTKEGNYRKSVTIQQGFAAKSTEKEQFLALLQSLQEDETFKATLIDILQCPPTVYNEQQWETLNALTQLLPLLAAQLSVVFQEKGEIDFIELNLAALRALGSSDNPTDLTLYLDHQIQHLLIDEFQDTSVIHLEMITKLISGWEPNDGRTLFVVGDPMQSIYRFRHAEVGLFIRTQQMGIGSVQLEPLTLTMNFRSQQGMIQWFNQQFSMIFPKTADIASGRVPYTPAIAASSILNEQSVYHYFGTDNASASMQMISALKQLSQEHPEDSLAVLARSRSHLKEIIRLLHEHKIPFQAVDIELLVDCPEIQDLLSLTQALLHWGDRIAWLSLLRAPFCGLSLEELHAVATINPRATLWENCQHAAFKASPRLQRIIHCLQQAFLQQKLHSLSQWIKGIWIELGGPATVDYYALTQVQHYFDLLDTHSNAPHPFQIKRFKEDLQKCYAKPTEGNTTLQLMTIHKSKGLEFDHVFIPSLHQAPPHQKEKLFRWLERPNTFGENDLLLAPIRSSEMLEDDIVNFLKRAEQQKLDHEITRLFYVAATRAKKSLHLFANITADAKTTIAKKPVERSFLHLLWPLLKDEADVFCQKQIKTERVITTHELPFKRLSNEWRSPLLLAEKPMDSAPLIHIPLTVFSNTPAIIGTMIHLILQRASMEPSYLLHYRTGQWNGELLQLGLLQDELDDANGVIQKVINTISQCERARWILHPHAASHSEWALTTWIKDEFQQIIIDRSFIDENNTRWIIDYKTSCPTENESMQNFLMQQKALYLAKLNVYGATLSQIEERSIKMGLYFPLCKGWIEWEYVGAASVVL